MRKPDIKGLSKLARIIARTPKKNFDMSNWWVESPCGTSGCIAGHAAAIFPARFKKVVYADEDEPSTTRYDVVHRRTGNTGDLAFADGFHIPVEIADELVFSYRIRTPKGAAKKVMALVGKLKKDLKK